MAQRILTSGNTYFWRTAATGQSVLLSELQDSIGVLQPDTTQIVFPEAFTDFRADIRYRNSRSALEQDVIFIERPPAPAEYGLNAETTRLQLLTEFFEAPEPTKTTVQRQGVNDDVLLDFGTMKIGVGKGFMADNQADSIRVEKQWTILEGRTFLIEQVPYLKIKPYLDSLPVAPQAGVRQADKVRHVVSTKRLLPERKLASIKTSESIRVASVPRENTGFVLDYSLLTSQSNFTFKGDTTYYVDDIVWLAGVTTWEGGAVIKYGTNEYNPVIAVETNVFKASEYRPVVFTSLNDDSIGETISGSTGNPWTNHCAYAAIYQLSSSSIATTMKHVRFSHLRIAVDTQESTQPLTIRHGQFVRCQYPFFLWGAPVNIYNGLFYDADTVFYGRAILNAQNVTVNKCNYLGQGGSSGFSLALTNVLLVAVTNMGDYTVESNATVRVTNETGVLQTVGAGAQYLVDGSTNRNAGTTNIEAQLALDLRSLTTYPPMILSNNISAPTTLNPLVQRDTDVPDIGYHYYPLDYALQSISVSSTLIVTNGAAIGLFAGFEEGLNVVNDGVLISSGQADRLNHFAWYNMVQEQASGAWATTWVPYTFIIGTEGPTDVHCRFTAFSRDRGPHFVDYFGWGLGGSSTFEHCQFRGGLIEFRSWINESSAYVAITNCLFDRTPVTLAANGNDLDAYLYNCHFNGGGLYFTSVTNENPTFSFTCKDTFFDRTFVTNWVSVTHSNNAYFTGEKRLLPTNTVNDVVVSSFAFSEGPLGYFYQPNSSSVADAGSRNATDVGLYHFTSTANLNKETNSVVDIGFHYVTTSSGQPSDADSDGVPDYLEDANGNGSVNSGETHWQSADDLGLKVWITQPKRTSNIP